MLQLPDNSAMVFLCLVCQPYNFAHPTCRKHVGCPTIRLFYSLRPWITRISKCKTLGEMRYVVRLKTIDHENDCDPVEAFWDVLC